MNIHQALTLFSILSGFAASIFFIESAFNLKKEQIYKMATVLYIHNSDIAKDLCTQKVNFIYGTFLLAASFFANLIIFFFPEGQEIIITDHYNNGVVFTLSFFGFLLVSTYIAKRFHRTKLVKYQESEWQKEIEQEEAKSNRHHSD